MTLSKCVALMTDKSSPPPNLEEDFKYEIELTKNTDQWNRGLPNPNPNEINLMKVHV